MRLQWLICAAVIAPCMSACGGDDGATTTGSSGGGSPTSGATITTGSGGDAGNGGTSDTGSTGDTGGTGGTGGAGGTGASGGGGSGSGGGVTIPGDATFKSGSRLRAYVLESEKTHTFVTFVDTTLDVPCGFGEHADGAHICLPKDSYVTNTFADAACTVPLAAPSLALGVACDTTGGPRYATAQAGDAVCVGNTYYADYLRKMRVYEVGALHTGDTYSKDGGACAKVANANEPRFKVGNEVPASTFVSAVENWVLIGARAEVRVLEASDGAKLVDVTRDKSTGSVCDFFPGLAENELRCYPPFSAESFGRQFLDPGCTGTQVATYHRDEACAEPAHAWSYETKLPYKIGNEVTLDKVFSGKPSSCNPAPDPGKNTRFFEMGAEIPIDNYFQAQWAFRGDGRLQESVIELPTGERIEGGGFTYDSVVQWYCAVGLYDGKTVCMISASGTGQASGVRYADNACTIPLRGYAKAEDVPLYVTLESGTADPCDHFAYTLNLSVTNKLVTLVPYSGPIFQKVFNTCEPSSQTQLLYFKDGPSPAASDFGSIIGVLE